MCLANFQTPKLQFCFQLIIRIYFCSCQYQHMYQIPLVSKWCKADKMDELVNPDWFREQRSAQRAVYIPHFVRDVPCVHDYVRLSHCQFTIYVKSPPISDSYLVCSKFVTCNSSLDMCDELRSANFYCMYILIYILCIKMNYRKAPLLFPC